MDIFFSFKENFTLSVVERPPWQVDGTGDGMLTGI